MITNHIFKYRKLKLEFSNFWPFSVDFLCRFHEKLLTLKIPLARLDAKFDVFMLTNAALLPQRIEGCAPLSGPSRSEPGLLSGGRGGLKTPRFRVRFPVPGRPLAPLPRPAQPAVSRMRAKKNLVTLLDLCVSSLRRGHANLLCIVPILSDDLRGESS